MTGESLIMKRSRTRLLCKFLGTFSEDNEEKQVRNFRSTYSCLVDVEHLKKVKMLYKPTADKGESCLPSYLELLGFPRQFARIPVQNGGSEISLEHMKSIISTHIRESNPEFFKQNGNVKYFTRCICVDGTCAVGKSTLLQKTMENTTKIISSEKISDYYNNFISRNSHVSSSIGYLFTGLKLMQEKPYSVWDRTPYNNLTWNRIWCIISDVCCNDVSLYEKEGQNLSYNKLWQWSKYANCMHPCVSGFLARCAKTFLLIDSKEEQAQTRLRNRACKSDVERSFWPKYIQVQNYFYINLWNEYPDAYCLIDVGLYRDLFECCALKGDDKAYFDCLHDCISNIIEGTMAEIIEGNILVEGIQFSPCMTDKDKKYRSSKGTNVESIRPLFTVNFTEGLKECIRVDLH